MYNLKELCHLANITPPIMKKYQMLFKLGKGNKKTRRTYYTEEQAMEYRAIALLRELGVPYNTIKKLKNKFSQETYSLIANRFSGIHLEVNWFLDRLGVLSERKGD